MSNIGSRPYVGTWRLSATKLVQHTPDALVYINGDTALPGCPKCNGRIDIQQFITEVSVDAGTDPGSHSASFSLSIPLHHTDSFARDARFLLRPGLEVHVYMRGYFPVKGLYEHLAEPTIPDEQLGASGQRPVTKDGKKSGADGAADRIVDGGAGKRDLKSLISPSACKKMQDEGRASGGCTPAHFTDTYMKELQTLYKNPALSRDDISNNMIGTLGMMEAQESYLSQYYGGASVNLRRSGDGLTSPSPGKAGHVEASQHYVGTAVDYTASVYIDGKWKKVPQTVLWASAQRLRGSGHWPKGGDGIYLKAGQEPSSDPTWSGSPHFDHGGKRGWVWVDGVPQKPETKEKYLDALQPIVDAMPQPGPKVPAWKDGAKVTVGTGGSGASLPPAEVAREARGLATKATQVEGGPSLLAQLGLAGQGVEDVLAYPYYHVFRGVVTQVDHSYSGGVQGISVSCASLLHFWQYHTMSTNASVFGARPTNSKLRKSLKGHVFTGHHPYQIIWTLHNDMVGAAGGVAWALRSKSNQDAKTEFGGESLFSLNIRYWERRFSLKETKLRLHGATGELFSSMQAAFLARTRGGQLGQLLKARFGNRAAMGKIPGLLEQAKSVGLFNKHKLGALNYAARSKGAGADNTTKFEINLVSMHAFVSNIGNWGQINLFESAYESKLDVAQKVMEITGFEFYQDVDGDFVFKPPMYNLDTSGSRVYRIEDIDIQNISFSEKEPEVTYMTVTGGHFKNLQGMGLDGEWGVRGQYIDYRLVAQFGWRPGDFETSYFNDARSMFFSAMNRMDILNIGVNSASATIPIRAEFRPGYPVYIPYLDCFYYCNSFAHAFSAGGSCTTSLQLVGKRSKFYAPGDPAKTGIEAIDLGNTVLPQRPLEVLGLSGKPNLSGFPNVVMALDPDHLNPLFFVVGTDLENLAHKGKRYRGRSTTGPDGKVKKGKWIEGKWTGDEAVLRNLLRAARTLGLVKSVEDGAYTVLFPTADPKNPEEVVFFFKPGGKASEGQIDLMKAGGQYGDAQEDTLEAANKKSKPERDAEKALEKLVRKYQDAYAQQARATTEEKQVALAEKVSKLDLKIAAAQAKLDGIQAADGGGSFDETLNQKGFEMALQLKRLLEYVQAEYRSKIGDQRFGDFDSTINLLDMLSDKKATFSNGTQAGAYRYYSSGHPDPKHQGQPILQYNRELMDMGDPELGAVVHLGKAAAEVDVDWDSTCPQYLPTKKIHTPANALKAPEAQLMPGERAKLGLRVLTSNGAKPLGEVLPTHEIRELMFSVQSAVFGRVGSLVKGKAYQEAVKSDVLEALGSAFINAIVEEPDKSPEDLWNPAMKKFVTALEGAAQAGQDLAQDLFTKEGITPAEGVEMDLTQGTIPSPFKVGGKTHPSDAAFSNYPYKGNPDLEEGEEVDPEYKLNSPYKLSLRVVMEHFAGGVAKAVMAEFWTSFRSWIARLEGEFGNKAKEHVPAVRSRFWTWMAAAYKFRTRPVNEVLLAAAKRKKDISFSPVFPVSDSRGYEVIGSYRYGRDVRISPNGVWDQMANQDPLSLLDKESRDKLLQLYVQGKSVTVMLPKLRKGEMNEDGTETWVVDTPVKLVPQTLVPKEPGSKADPKQTELTKLHEAFLLEQLRRSLTNSQILEYGLATVGADPNILELNLANWVSDGREGIHKMPVINAAYSLADLGLHTNQNVCQCKAAEAGTLVQAYGQEEFLIPQDSGPVESPQGVDRGTQYVRQVNHQARAAWQQAQNAMRGTSPDRGRSSIVSQFRDIGKKFKQQDEAVKVRAKALKQVGAQINEDADALFNGEDQEGES